MVTIASVDVWRRFTDEENSESQLGAAVRKGRPIAELRRGLKRHGQAA